MKAAPLVSGAAPWHAWAMRLALALCLGTATAAAAQSPMGPEAFERYTTGRTLTFSADGTVYGAEEYRADRRVRWSFLDGACREGRWYPEGDRICFVYEDAEGPRCWLFFRGDGGLRAEFAGDPGDSVLYETDAGDEPLTCLGPEVGV